MIFGVVISGGYSSRMARNKMLLKYKGEYLINHTIKEMLPHVDQVIVVTGHYHQEIVDVVSMFDNVEVVRNEAYDKGMFSSVKKGVELVEGDFFIIPGDYPLITSDVYQMLISKTGEIRVPTYQGYKGHPIFLERHLKKALLEFDDDANLKVFRDSKDVTYYETNCSGITKDIDTIDDYKTMIERNG
jgi:molybdenum cofactor cytidylyltransferase